MCGSWLAGAIERYGYRALLSKDYLHTRFFCCQSAVNVLLSGVHALILKGGFVKVRVSGANYSVISRCKEICRQRKRQETFN